MRREQRLSVSLFSTSALVVVLLGCVMVGPSLALYQPTTDGVVVIPVEGTIELGLSSFLKRVVEEAERRGDQGIVLEMDTPGGRVDAAVICKHVLFDANIPVSTFVSRQAISAGAMIALSTEKIFMAPSAGIGDIEPIPCREKIVTYMRQQMREIADRRGHDSCLLESMVDRDLDVVWIDVDGQQKAMLAKDFEALKEQSETAILLKGIAPAGTLLTLTTKEALEVDIAEGQYDNLESYVRDTFGDNAILHVESPNWAERLVRFLTNPTVSALLFTLGFWGLFAEITSPGVGFMGGAGFVCLSLYFWAQYLTGLAGLEVFFLLLAGIVLLAMEIFVIPGFGVAGVGGAAALGGGVIWSFAKLCQFDYSLMATHLVGSIAILAVLVFLTIKYLPRSTVWSQLTLAEEVATEGGYVAVPEELSELVGAEGIALSDLRPSGKARIDGRKVDVVTEGDYLDKGDMLVVYQVIGGRIIVRREINKISRG